MRKARLFGFALGAVAATMVLSNLGQVSLVQVAYSAVSSAAASVSPRATATGVPVSTVTP